MGHMVEVLFYGFLLGVLVIGAIQHDHQRKAHERAMEALKASLPKMAEIIAEAKFEQHRIFQRMIAQTGTSSVSLQRRVVHIQRRGTITLNCHRDSQLLWLRWKFDTGEHELLDFWQFAKEREMILTTQKCSIPAWAANTPSCIKKSAVVWRLSVGDRVASVNSWKQEGDAGEIVNIYEADADALVIFAQEENDPQLSHLDNSPQAMDQARAAFAAANHFGPPRTIAVDPAHWDLTD